MIGNQLNRYNIILGSQSPRRQDLLGRLNLAFDIEVIDVDEDFPDDIPPREVAPFLSNLKSRAFLSNLTKNDLLITADTTVILDDKVINKPVDRKDAIRMLSELSGNMHTVVTGVTLTTLEKHVTFSSETDVYFRELDQAEIEYYIDRYEPYDKAGSYGIQEWLGYVGIEKIDGCFFNVMGLPLEKLYEKLNSI